MSDRSRMIIEALGHWLLAWVLVVLAVSLWAAILRPRRATVRYVGWLLATFAGAALLPGVVAIGPRISWREILPRSRPVVRPSTLERPTFSLRSWFEDLPRAPKPVLSSRQENPSNDDPIKTAMHDRTIQSPALPVGSAPHAAGDRWPTLGVILWLAGFLVFAARLIGSAFRVRAMLASLDLAVSDDLNRHMDRIRTDLGIRRRVRIASHSDLLAPMCMGLLRPMILWPRAENCPMNPRQQLASLTHELAHFRHGDDWIALFAEIWRALTWFFLPVHIALRFLNREREYRCDDLAATALESPEDYARWLLDLAPMSVGPSPPLVAASLLGRTSLMERIARIARGDLCRSRRPLERRHWLSLTIAATLLLGAAGSVRLIGFIGHARADEPHDTPLPPMTPRQLAARIREAWKPYDDRGVFEIAFDETQDTNWKFESNEGNADDQEPILVNFRGRARYVSNGRQWRAEYDAMKPYDRSPELIPDRWSTGFDGETLYDWMVSKDCVILHETHEDARRRTARSLFWGRASELVAALEANDPEKTRIAIERRIVDGAKCYVINIGDSNPNSKRVEFVVSPRQGYLPIRRIETRNGQRSESIVLSNLREVTPGIWSPERIEHEQNIVRDDGASRLSVRRTIRVASYLPLAAINPDTLKFTLPYDVIVTDPRLGYSYQNDPWRPEVSKLLRERFEWPKPDLSPLQELGTLPSANLGERPVPPIRVASWLSVEHPDPARLRGKVVLLDFVDELRRKRSRLVPALNRLYQTYHPFGLEVIAIHSPHDDPDEIRRVIRDYGITYPIAADSPGEPRARPPRPMALTSYLPHF